VLKLDNGSKIIIKLVQLKLKLESTNTVHYRNFQICYSLQTFLKR